jgi:uncharacterized protein (TIGR00730 family)
MKTISIFCGSKDTCTNPQIEWNIIDLFKTLCELHIKTNNIKLAYGGGTHGWMRIIHDFCKLYNIPLLSVNCTRWKEDCYHTEEILFDSILERQDHLIKVADLFIVLPGGIGTMFEALQAITLNDVKEASKPIVFFNINGYFNELLKMMEHAREIGTINRSNQDLNVHVCNDISQIQLALEQILNNQNQ